MNCYIIDDEKSAIGLLTTFINKTPGLKLLGSNTNPVEGLAQIKKLNPDLVFSDINMPEVNGLSLAALVSQNGKTKIVFTTGYKKYAHKAFEVDAAGYLVKPFPYNKFLAVVHKVEILLGLERGSAAMPTKTGLPEYYFFRSGKKSLAVVPSEIDYIHSRDNYADFVCGHEITTIRSSLTGVMNQVHPEYFARVSRFYIIPVKKIKEVTTHTVTLECGYIIPLGGDHFRKQFFERIGFAK
jgi:two-component system, LytTR family, response regulator